MNVNVCKYLGLKAAADANFIVITAIALVSERRTGSKTSLATCINDFTLHKLKYTYFFNKIITLKCIANDFYINFQKRKTTILFHYK